MAGDGQLLAEVRAASGRQVGPCGVGRFAATLTKADASDLAVALADETVSTAAIHKALAARGLTQKSNAVRMHRRGECGCGPTR